MLVVSSILIVGISKPKAVLIVELLVPHKCLMFVESVCNSLAPVSLSVRNIFSHPQKGLPQCQQNDLHNANRCG